MLIWQIADGCKANMRVEPNVSHWLDLAAQA
jgi:hypothetical protein